MNNGKTVIIHQLEARNDVTNDNGWENIMVAVALDHDAMEVVGADVSEGDLIERMQAQGFTVAHEDDEFVRNGLTWVRKPTPDQERASAVESVVTNICLGRNSAVQMEVHEHKDDPTFVLDVVALMIANGGVWMDAQQRLARILADRR
jgi:hypothetical protein